MNLSKLKLVVKAVADEIDLRDLVGTAGIALVGYGLHLVYVPASFIVVGLVLIYMTRPR